MKYLELLERTLMEINMSPTALRQAAGNINALAGMEFEMILPDIETDVEPEWEPDMDQDQRTRSFSDIRDFFHDGDYNGRREVDNLIEELDNEYQEWIQEQTADAWEREGVDFMRDFIDVNDLFDRDEAMAEARDEVMTANPDLPQESEDFQKLVSARIDELQEQFVLEAFEDKGNIYDDAFEAFAEEQRDEYDELSFLDDRYRYMSDIDSSFDINWPHYYDINDGQDGDMDIDQVADEFGSYMGKPVNASSSYHGARRAPGHYVVEPDGSLEGDNPGDGGLEFVSPPMPIDEMLEDLNKVKRWADKIGAYTNDSTGLHINVSVPNYSLEKLDFVKLALLMGDEYILDEFGRSSNTYAKSAAKIIKQHIEQQPEDAAKLLDTMRSHLSTSAAKAIHSGSTSKYTSINTKTGYIEFRSPGGDWLNENFGKIENTLMRFVVAMDAALDETKYKEEYAKKLYKVLSPGNSDPGIIELFTNYSSGELDKAALIRQVRQKQLSRNVSKGKTTGPMWWNVSRPGYMASIEVVANNAEEAIASAILPGNYPDWASAKNTLRATPVRPYEVKPNGPTLNNRPSNPDGNYVIVSQQDESVPVYRFMASGDQDAISVLRQWIAANPGLYRWTFKKDAEQALGQPGSATSSATSSTQGNWGIWIGPSQRFARQPNTIVADNVLRRFPSQQAAEQFLARTREENPRMRTDVEVREIPSDYELPSTPVGRPMGSASQPATNTAQQSGRYTYRVFTDTNQTVGTFQSDGIQGSTGAMVAFRNYLRSIGRDSAAGFNYEEIGREQAATQDNWSADFERRMTAGTADVAGGTEWDVVNLTTGQTIGRVTAADQRSAERAMSPVITQFNTTTGNDEDDDYGVRPATQSAPRTLTRPGQGQQAFTGEWRIVDANDREIHRFGGVGNVQADANRIAIDWLRQNPRHMQAGVQVLPVMR